MTHFVLPLPQICCTRKLARLLSKQLGTEAAGELEAMLIHEPEREMVIVSSLGHWNRGRLIYGIGDSYATLNSPQHAEHIPAIHPFFRTIVVCAALTRRRCGVGAY